MRVLIFGRTGQVATELARRMPSDITATFVGRDRADLCTPASCATAIASCPADAVINAAAWTMVDKAESEEARATVVNAHAPAVMARECALRGIPFLHISTDYVFNGQGSTAFAPDAQPAPQNAYGRSKLAGEVAIRGSGARHLILRTSWVVSAHGTNFLKTMLRLGREREALRVVSDQIGGPTPATTIADALVTAIRVMTAGQAGGTYHFAGAPDVSWAEFARAIMRTAALPCRIEAIPTEAYPTLARRPLNSRLDCSSFTRDFGITRPDWRTKLIDIVKEVQQ